MDRSSFARIVGSMVHSRRSVLGVALAAAAGWLPVHDALATRQRKRRRKKERPNAFGCLEVGDPCKRADQCCSGVCQGKKGKKTCRAHDTGTCEQGITGVCATPANEIELRKCNNDFFCFCFETTAGSNYCAAPPSKLPAQCADCQTDADCVALGYPPTAACAPFSQGNCAGFCPTGMACLVPCGTELPAPVG